MRNPPFARLPTPAPDWLHAFAAGLIPFILYAATTPHTVALEDDGLFIMAAHFLGVAHPPGYPTHTLIGKLFTLLPFGSIAYRVHLASAFFGAATCSLAWLIGRRLDFGRLAAYGAALCLGVSKVFWSQAIIAEVYTLNTFFFLLVFFITLKAIRKYHSGQDDAGHLRILSLWAFIYGLSLTNHWPLMILASPAYLWLLWPQIKLIFRHIVRLSSFFFLGLTPYAWVIFRSQSNPLISFSGPIESLTEFWIVISRSNYVSVDHSVSATWNDTLQFVIFTLSEIASQFTLLGLLVAIFGIAWLWRSQRTILAATSSAFLITSVLLVLLVNFDYDYFRASIFRVYLLVPYCAMALWIGAGLEYARKKIHLLQSSKVANPVFTTGLCCFIFLHHYPENNRSDYDWSRKYADAIFQSTPANADLFLLGDLEVGVMGYFHLVENRRPDIRLFNHRGLVFNTRLSHYLRASEEERNKIITQFAQTSTRPLIFTNQPPEGMAHTQQWLTFEINPQKKENRYRLPNHHLQLFKSLAIEHQDPDIWTQHWQNELRRSYASMLIINKSRNQLPTSEEYEQAMELASRDFYGKLGLVEGYFTIPKAERPLLRERVQLLKLAAQQLPPNIKKEYLSRFIETRGYLKREAGDLQGAYNDLVTASSIWPQGKQRTQKWIKRFEQELANRPAPSTQNQPYKKKTPE